MQSAIEFLISKVKSSDWDNLYSWHREDIFEEARRMDREQRNNESEARALLERNGYFALK